MSKRTETPRSSSRYELDNIKGYGSPSSIEKPQQQQQPQPLSSLSMSFSALSESEKEVILNLLSSVPDDHLSFSKDGERKVRVVYKADQPQTPSSSSMNTSRISNISNSNIANIEKKPVRTLDWALRLLDDIYNSRYQCFLAEIVSPDGSLETFSSFVFNHLSKRLGLESLVKQTTSELLECVKYYRDVSKQLELFGLFLTPYYSAVDLMFFLYCRSQVINECVEGNKIPYVNRKKKVKLGVVPHYVPISRIPFLTKKSLKDQPRQLIENCKRELLKLISKKTKECEENKKKNKKPNDFVKKTYLFAEEPKVELYEYLILILVNYKAFRESKNSNDQYYFYTILAEDVPSYNRVRNKDLHPYIVLRETSNFRVSADKKLRDEVNAPPGITRRTDPTYFDLVTESEMLDSKKQRRNERQIRHLLDDNYNDENGLMSSFLNTSSSLLSVGDNSFMNRSDFSTDSTKKPNKNTNTNGSLAQELTDLSLEDLLENLTHSKQFENQLKKDNNEKNQEESIEQRLQEIYDKIENSQKKKNTSNYLDNPLSFEDELREQFRRSQQEKSIQSFDAEIDHSLEDSYSMGDGYELDDDFLHQDDEDDEPIDLPEPSSNIEYDEDDVSNPDEDDEDDRRSDEDDLNELNSSTMSNYDKELQLKSLKEKLTRKTTELSEEELNEQSSPRAHSGGVNDFPSPTTSASLISPPISPNTY
ncbi:predicted protein [Naegleria gruberi]|uniref:Predicted protein n=1 Tax=Naegleria gruberi TaxID=5762 RepID=D2VH79_NAEGR|nr:uncharacterized protein NAEGRDRAFT_49563 [Naegleria gruberi]EFC43933.1 predicted protein [Naegleria gruberi]|eukprot:XP_002676677.1 predicted protein [Naegleria gruberi strain NEG-M]